MKNEYACVYVCVYMHMCVYMYMSVYGNRNNFLKEFL